MLIDHTSKPTPHNKFKLSQVALDWAVIQTHKFRNFALDKRKTNIRLIKYKYTKNTSHPEPGMYIC